MNRTYKYPRFNPFVVIFAIGTVLLFAMVAKGYFEEAWRTTNLIARVVAIFVGFFFAAGCLFVLAIEIVSLLGLKKIIADGEFLTIQNSFSKRIVPWKDITEFGTYTAGYYPRVGSSTSRERGSMTKRFRYVLTSSKT